MSATPICLVVPACLVVAIVAGAQEFITKPFDDAILIGKFAQVGLP